MSVVTTDNFERFVVRGHNRLDVMGREGVCNSYTLYAGQDMPEALWGLLGNRTGYMTLDDTANSCAMDLVIEAMVRLRKSLPRVMCAYHQIQKVLSLSSPSFRDKIKALLRAFRHYPD
ncbi:MAG: hypothetical protein LRY76_07165 [Alphaproteobacteria bacterium]|nr:hypothetical protein [Alphaproteobacteria bacterium]